MQAVDPLGGTERVEFRWSTTDLAATAPANQVPTGFSAYNQNLDHYNSIYWDKRAMAFYPDVSKATITHWAMYLQEAYARIYFAHGWSTSVPHSIKRPLENRLWFAHKDQEATGAWVGSWVQPAKTARVLDDGTSQISQATYNDRGMTTSTTDPLGRRTSCTYATNGIDLLETRQTTGSLNDLLTTYSNYTAQHLAQTTTDAAGQTTTSTYNSFGQILTSTNAKSETTTLTYDDDGGVETMTAPMAGAVTTYTYDAYGWQATVTQPDGYLLTTLRFLHRNRRIPRKFLSS